jgi:hypothetical protein
MYIEVKGLNREGANEHREGRQEIALRSGSVAFTTALQLHFKGLTRFVTTILGTTVN